MNSRQRAEYDDAIAGCRKLPPPLPVEILHPRSERFAYGTPQELELATRLLPHVSTYTVLDRREHALGVARMILRMGARP